MAKIDLCGPWNMRCVDGFFGEGKAVPASVPGSMYSNLLASGLMADPFIGENECAATELSAHDWSFWRTFDMTAADLAEDRVELVCEGLDTLAEIWINGRMLAATSDMHRTFSFDVRDFLRVGENDISILFKSASAYMRARHAELPIVGGGGNTHFGFNYLRKAHSMGGWDWGPVLPDAGIWRPIYVRAETGARLGDVYVTQNHEKKSETRTDVSLAVRARVRYAERGEAYAIAVTVTAPDGSVAARASTSVGAEHRKISVGYDEPGQEYLEVAIPLVIENAALWWPNNLGEQPLYGVSVELSDSTKIDEWSRSVGLRTLGVRRQKDEWGESFALTANGVAFFAMGADYVPEDSILARNSPEKTERLLRSAARANHNCVRVWGGANYPEDAFFDACDRLGLVVWHDHMMACGAYVLDGEFRENIVREIADNVKRIRHHASLGLWCGNNEQEEAWCTWGWSDRLSAGLKADYIKLYEEIMPALNRELDPATFYWLSSPSSGGSFDFPNDEARGDMHNWLVWHKLQPFTSYRNCFSRFVSEFGIEAFPTMKTVKAFASPDDMNLLSPVMESHQKCEGGNAKILHYIGETYRYPKDFDSVVYASQLTQADGLRHGVEHWRRNRNGERCMGAVYWQLNDCWPVASWAGIDYYGRWKALHYLSRRFFAPVLASVVESGTSVELHVTNETRTEFRGTVTWRLLDDSRTVNGAAALAAGKIEVVVPPFRDEVAFARDFADFFPNGADARRSAMRNAYFTFSLLEDNRTVSSGSSLFVPPKSFSFARQTLSPSVRDVGDSFEITVRADRYARFVELSTDGFDALFSDNYFDLAAGDSATVTVAKGDIFAESPAEGSVLTGVTVSSFSRALSVRSVADAF